MDKRRFGKLRDAVVEKSKSSGKDFRASLNDFRKLRTDNPFRFENLVNWYSTVRALKRMVGRNRYDLYMQVAQEVDEPTRDAWADELERVVFNEKLAKDIRSLEIRRLIVDRIDRLTQDILTNDRLKKEFVGEEDLLRRLVLQDAELKKLYWTIEFGVSEADAATKN